ncbi:MAG TPA: Ig-like domain-containing protein [Staphylococcus sp.]|nr:Ig-like domain-containing protein [Staphylococcus sp.]
MKNKQGFLPNRMNKYAIRKLTFGTASLLIGATLVFGVESEAQAAELDAITSNDNESGKGEALDIKSTETQSIEDTNENNTKPSTQYSITDNQEINEITNKTQKINSTEEVNEIQEIVQVESTSQPTTAYNDRSQNEAENTETNVNKNETLSNETVETNKLGTVDTQEKKNTHEESTASKEAQSAKDEIHTTEIQPTEETQIKVTEVKEKAPQQETESINEVQDTETNNQNESTSDINTQSDSELIQRLSTATDKEEAKPYLSSELSEETAQAIIDQTNIQFDEATNEQIDNEILKALAIQLANEQQENTVLATPQRTMLRSMATTTSLVSPTIQSKQAEKLLGYIDNYTFASLIFDPEALTSQTTLSGKEIDFRIDSYMSGSNSGDRYKIDLKLDHVIAKHVTKISVNPVGRKTPVEFIRLTDDKGKPTNTWEINFIRAEGGLFGGAEILSQYIAENGKIELNDTVENILKEAGDLSNNKLNYQIFVRDSRDNKIVRTSESSGYFLTQADSDLVQLHNNISSANDESFSSSSGSAVFDSTIGDHGGIVLDQQIIKSGTFNYIFAGNKQWSYHYQIDKDLLPFIQGAELHMYDYEGLAGFDKTYKASNKVADLTLDAVGDGKITSSNLNNLIAFNNSLPETVGIRIVLKLNQSVNNILTREAQYDTEGNLISETTKQKEDYTFAGYLTDNTGKLINNTIGTSTLGLQDYDKDGLLDRYEHQVLYSDPEVTDTDGDGKNDGDEVKKYKTSPLVGLPAVSDINISDTIVSGSVPLKKGAATQTAKVINSNNQVIGTAIVNSDGRFTVSIPHSPAGEYTIAIDSPNYDNDEVNKFKIIDNTIVPTPTINPVDDNDTELIVHGPSESTVTVTDNNNNVIGIVEIPNNSSTGTITLSTRLQAGTILTSTASENGKTSEVSNPITVTDATAPNAPVINKVSSEDRLISGTAEPGSSVRINFPGGGYGATTTDKNGEYTIGIPDGVILVGGEKITATAKDKAGNISDKRMTTVIDKTPPEAPTVNEVTSEDTQVTGQAEPYSEVTITFPDGTTSASTTDSEGNYTVEIPTNIDLTGGEVIKVTSTDKGENVSDEATIIVVDTTAPKAPTVNEVTSEGTEIIGQAEANSEVTITFPDGTTSTGTTDSNGNYTVEIPTNVDLTGGEAIKVTSTDKGGNVSEESMTTVIDTTAPEAPTVNEVTSEDTQVTGEAEAYSEVTVTFPDGTTAIGTADSEGNYTVDIPTNVDLIGGEEVKVTATDKNGNVSEESTTTVIDTTAPRVNEVTSEDTEITGQAEAYSEVTITFPDGTTSTGTTDSAGNYTVEIPMNVDLTGEEAIKVTSTDKSGNVSEESTTTVIDKTAPEAPTVNEVTSEDTQVTGQAEANSEVIVTFPGGTTAIGTADSEGNYTVDIPTNVDLIGGEEVKVTATDKSGNVSEESTTTVIDATAPKAPTVNEVTSKDTQVTGEAEPYSKVTVTFPDGTRSTGKADSKGNYTVEIPTNVDLIGGEEIKVTATDKNGNTSEIVSVIVITKGEEPKIDETPTEDESPNKDGEPKTEEPPSVEDPSNKGGEPKIEEPPSVEEPSNKGGEPKTEVSPKAEEPSNKGEESKTEEPPSVEDPSNKGGEPKIEEPPSVEDPSNKGGESKTEEPPSVEDPSNKGGELKTEEPPNAEGSSSEIVRLNNANTNKENLKNNHNNKPNKEKELPRTGQNETNKSMLLGTLFAGLGAILLFAKRRRKKDDNKN